MNSRREDARPLHLPQGAEDFDKAWFWRRLDSVTEGVFDCPHSTPTLTESGPYVVRSQDIRSGVVRLEQAARVSEGTYFERVVRAEPREGDLLYSREGTYFGIAAEVPSGVRVCLGQRMVLVRPKAEVVDSRFLRYWLNSPIMSRHIHGFRDGTVAERLNLPTIRALPVPIPNVSEQRAIAHVLGTLDEKIELNRRMNETLEALARAIFKSWFVDFDPVRAKAAGRRPYGMDDATAALFPDAFEDSELGKIPRGWGVGTIGDCVQVVGGSTPSTKEPEFWEGGEISFATPKDLASLAVPVLARTEKHITNAGLSKISSGLLPIGTVLLSSRAPIGYLAITEIPVAVNQGFIAMICDRMLPNDFVLRWAEASLDVIIGNANGTTFLEISKRNFRPIPVLIPSAEVLDRYVEIVRRFHQRVVTNVFESDTLATTRDTLLPKLLSGEIRVDVDSARQKSSSANSSTRGQHYDR